MFKNLLGAFGVVGGVTLFAAITKDIFEQTKELNSMNNALKSVSETEETYAKNKQFLTDVSDRYGLSLKETTKQYTSFYAAAKDKLSLQQLQGIFQNIAKSAGVLGLSIDQTEGAFRALEQMLSKGNVQAEEIRGQLGERLPGAFNILAKSMGVTTQELNKLLKDGKVLADEVLPKFAAEYAKSVGADQVDRVETLVAAQTRLSNSWTEFIEQLNSSETGGISRFFNFVLSGLNGIANALTRANSSWGEIYKKAYSGGQQEGRSMFASQLDMFSDTGSQEDIAKSIRNQAARTYETIQQEITKVRSKLKEFEDRSVLSRVFVGGTKDIRDLKNRLETLKNELGKARGQWLAANEFLNPEKVNPTTTTGSGKGQGGDPWAAVLAARLRYLRAFKNAEKENYETGRRERQKEIDELEKLAKNEQRSYEDRIISWGEYLKKREDLLSDSLQNEILLIEDQRAVELAEAEKALHTGLKQARSSVRAQAKVREYYAKQIVEINSKYDNASVKAKLNNDAEYLKIVEETSKAELEIIRRRNKVLESIDKEYRDQQADMFKENAENERLQVRVRQEAFRSYMALRQKQIDIDKQAAIASAIANGEDVKLVIAQFERIQKVFDKDYKEGSPFALELKRVNAELKSMSDNALDNFFGDVGFSSLKSLTDGTFQGILDGIDLITTETQEWGNLMDAESERFLKKFKAVYGAMTQIASDTYKLMNSQQEKEYQLQLGRIERQYKLDVQFAGDNTAAKEEIERKYEEKKLKLERARAKREREMAKFEAIVNTASAVVAALPNYALAAFVGILGAAQIAIINSTPLPQYYKGREGGKAEWAITQEQGAEAIVDKHGRLKSKGNNKGAQLTWLDEGDSVLTASETRQRLAFDKDFNNLMDSNGISQQGVVSLHFDYDKLGNVIARSTPKQSETEVSINHRGLNMYVKRNNQKTLIHNASLSNKARIV